MFVAFLFLSLGQNGLQNMCQAANCSNCSPSRSSYLNSTESITQMRLHATNVARNLMQHPDMIVPAITSSDPTHRVAAAFACGMSYKPDESLFMLLDDPEPIVSQAARESLTHISMVRLGKKVDFGPFPNSDHAHRADAANLWRIFYERNRIPSSPSDKESDDALTKNKRMKKPQEDTMEVDAKINRPLRKIAVETIDDSIPGMKIKRIDTKHVPDETH